MKKPNTSASELKTAGSVIVSRQIEETALDEALAESFPASDPVALGHSDRVGQPTLIMKPGRATITSQNLQSARKRDASARTS